MNFLSFSKSIILLETLILIDLRFIRFILFTVGYPTRLTVSRLTQKIQSGNYMRTVDLWMSKEWFLPLKYSLEFCT